MTSNRLWKLGTFVVVAAVIALGWFLGISPKLAEVAAADASRAAVDAQNAVHEQELLTLQQQYEAIDEIRAQLEELQKSMPASAGLPAFILQLNAMGATHGVSIQKISTSDALLYQLPDNPGTMLDEEGNVVPVPAAPANLITIPMTINIGGSYQSILGFTRGLQSGERLFLATELTIAGGATAEDGSTSYVAEITGLVFVLPE